MQNSPENELLDSSDRIEIKVKESNGETESKQEASANGEEQKSLNLLGDNSSYELLELLGEGGMGHVYKAKDKRTGSLVAIKILQSKFAEDAAALKRFKLEAQAAQSLKHGNLNEVFDYNTTSDGTAYIVMNYIEGKSLRELISAQNVNSSPKELLELFIQIADGLGYAHENGVVHRDVKPSNVMIAEQTAKLLDFGIAISDKSAVRETQDLTRTGEVFGSPQYMSPEQCLGFKLDARSDIYSLGCLIYEVLTGKPPFDGENPIQLVVSHINENPQPFKKEFKKDNYSKKLERVVLKCLEKDQADRYQNANDLKKDLNLILANKAIPKYESKVNYKASFSVRNMIALAAALCLLAPVLIVFQPDYFPYWITQVVTGSAFLAACVTGTLTFGNMANELIKEGKSIGLTRRGWFKLFTSTSLAFTGISLAPYTVCNYFLTNYRHISKYEVIPTEVVSFIMFWSIVLAAITLVLSFVAGAGWFLYRKANSKESIVKPLAILMVVTISSVPITVQLAPKKVADLVNRLANLSRKFAPDTAISLYKTTTELTDYYNSYSPYSITSIYKETGREQEAIQYVSAILKNIEDDGSNKHLYSSLLGQRALLYADTNQFEKSKADWKKIDSQQDGSANYALVGIAEAEAVQGNLQEALKNLNKCIRANPAYSNSAYGTKVSVLCRFGKYDQAQKLLDWLIEGSNRKNTWLCTKGIIYENTGKKTEAEEQYKKGLEVYEKLHKLQRSGNTYGIGYGYINPSDHLQAAFMAERLGLKERSKIFKNRGHGRGWSELPKENLKKSLNLKISNLDTSW